MIRESGECRPPEVEWDSLFHGLHSHAPACRPSRSALRRMSDGTLGALPGMVESASPSFCRHPQRGSGRAPSINGSQILRRNIRLRSCFVLCIPLSIVPRDGAQTLSEVPGRVLSIICEPCGRLERYDVERLTRQYGWDAQLTDLLPALVVDCPSGARSVSMTGARRRSREDRRPERRS